jgi:hypothetical protein
LRCREETSIAQRRGFRIKAGWTSLPSLKGVHLETGDCHGAPIYCFCVRHTAMKHHFFPDYG